MPRLQDIERFKRDLAALSREEEVLARWGESPEEIAPPPLAPPPAGGAAAAGASRAASAGAPAQAPRRAAPEPEAAVLEQPEEGLPPDFAALLDELPLERGEEAEGPAPSPASIDQELESLLGMPEPSAVSPEPFAVPAEPSAAPAEPAARESEAAEAALGAIPELETSGQPSGLEPLPEFEIPEQAPGAEVVQGFPEFEIPGAEAGVEPGALETLPEFEMPAAAEIPEPVEARPEAEVPREAEGAEAFEIPEIAFPSEEVAAAPEAAPTPEAGETFEIPEIAEGGPAPAEGFSFSFEEPIGAEEAAPAQAAQAAQAAEAAEGAAEAPPAEAAAPGPSADAFESFSFEEPGAAGFELGAELGPGIGKSLDEELESLGETPQATTFNIDQEWGGFGAPQAGAGTAPPRAAPPRPSARPATEEKYRAVSLSESQVDRLQDSLLSYPLNLRVAIEDILANERGSMAQRSKLVWAMVEGAAADEVAPLASRVLQKSIQIPKGFEKKTGAAREAEKGSVGYIFIHTVLPVLRIALVAAVAIAAMGWLGYRFVYRALAADAAYRAGYQRIAEERYPEAESSFAKAIGYREDLKWYYRYAQAYVAKRQYLLAEKKYASLIDRHPKETAGILAWAQLERDQLKYEEAVKVLKGVPRRPGDESTRGMTGLLSWDYFNKDGLLLLGDIYLDWAEEDPTWYEEARRSYAGLIQRYGQKDEFLERMLLYFIRTDNLKEVKPLIARYLAGVAAAESKQIPLGARTLAELGGYLLDKGLIENVHTALNAAALKDPSLPEAHYHLARYFRRSSAPEEERKALDNAIRCFASQSALSAKREGMYIDSLIWRGDFRLAGDEWLSAEEDFGTAAAEYERGLAMRRLKPSPRFAEAYAGLAEVAYWQRDDRQSAFDLYERAAADGYDTPDTRYKRGYILYRAGRTADCLPYFYRAGLDGGAGSPYLDYAFGAALYARGDFYAAEGSFRRVVEGMARELEQIDMPSPQAKPSQGEITELLMKAQNNLGAAIYRAALRVGDARRRSAAMAAFSESTRLFDALTRDQATLVRSEAKNLGFLNMDFLLHPQRGMDIAIYADIAREMRFPRRQR